MTLIETMIALAILFIITVGLMAMAVHADHACTDGRRPDYAAV